MDINDIFIENDDKKGFTVCTTSFIPKATDEALRETLNQIIGYLEYKSICLTNISLSEFNKSRNEIITGLTHDITNVKIIANELMELRKLTNKIQQERNVLAEYIAKDIFNGKICNNVNYLNL